VSSQIRCPLKLPTDLKFILEQIDGKGYKAFKKIKGDYQFTRYSLIIDHVQADPFAAPSRIRIIVSQRVAGFPLTLFRNASRQTALEDYIGRQFSKSIHLPPTQTRETFGGHTIAIESGGQEILKRSAVNISIDRLEVRFFVRLPASGRKILGDEAIRIFLEEIPRMAYASLFYESLNQVECLDHVETGDDSDALRNQLLPNGLVAFVAKGSLLPRRSGIDDRPLDVSRNIIFFNSPPEKEIELIRPNKGPIKGMGIPKGITLIVGGGFHGKSTLLRALERGVYNHIPGDGRENIVSVEDAIKIRAEEGRSIIKVNLSPFINRLPFGQPSESFSTENASGSTSQAANIMESLEIGTSLLLMDEDTCATNFMVRDEWMQSLVPKEKEPITPFLDKVRLLFRDHGVSTILISGGSGDYFSVADQVIMMDHYSPKDVTKKSKEIVKQRSHPRKPEGGEIFGVFQPRVPLLESLLGRDVKEKGKIKVMGLKTLRIGNRILDLTHLEQLVETGQTKAIADMIFYFIRHFGNEDLPIKEGIQRMFDELNTKSFDMLTPFQRGDYALPRKMEFSQALNRIRTLKIRNTPYFRA